MELILGAGHIDRVISDVDMLLRGYREDIGYEYLNYQPVTPANILFPEDLAVTLLVNSRATYRAFQSLQRHGQGIQLDGLPAESLEQISNTQLTSLAEVISTVAQWPGFAASLATKVLHKKRPDLIPILDNRAIFGAYMNPYWPVQQSLQESVRDQIRIEQALLSIKSDLTRPENQSTWQLLKESEPAHSLIEIFDSVWWMYFRDKEPVA
jgi:Family of unknown function (DUF6308)